MQVAVQLYLKKKIAEHGIEQNDGEIEWVIEQVRQLTTAWRKWDEKWPWYTNAWSITKETPIFFSSIRN